MNKAHINPSHPIFDNWSFDSRPKLRARMTTSPPTYTRESYREITDGKDRSESESSTEKKTKDKDDSDTEFYFNA